LSQNQSPQLSADDVLKDITRELERPTPAGPPIVEALAAAKKRQKEFRNVPVLGDLVLLKNLVFGLNRSTFLQQFEINELILELLDDLYYETTRYQTLTNQRLAQLEQQVRHNQKGADGADSLISLQSMENKDADMPVLAGLPHIFTVPAEMQLSERLLLYSLIYGLKPAVCLEIGVFKGGSALIICAALDDIGQGRLIAIDPVPKISTDDWERLARRTEFIYEPSPGATARAYEIAKQAFDFVLIDGDHTYEGVLQDLEGVLPYLAEQAYLLFHDCHYPEVGQAIDHALQTYPDRLTDCSILSVGKTQVRTDQTAGPVDWGGFRLIRFVEHT
jgi:predicted O-methyltransferase YrrM